MTLGEQIAVAIRGVAMPHCADSTAWRDYGERVRQAVLAVAPELAGEYWRIRNAAGDSVVSCRQLGEHFARAAARVRGGKPALTRREMTKA